jgi:hypothetical protein
VPDELLVPLELLPELLEPLVPGAPTALLLLVFVELMLRVLG